MSDYPTSADRRPTFEQTYPRYEFAELVRIGLALAVWLVRLRRRRIVELPGTLEPTRGTDWRSS